MDLDVAVCKTVCHAVERTSLFGLYSASRKDINIYADINSLLLVVGL